MHRAFLLYDFVAFMRITRKAATLTHTATILIELLVVPMPCQSLCLYFLYGSHHEIIL